LHGRDIRLQALYLAGAPKKDELTDPEKVPSETILRKPAPDLHELNILSRRVHSVKYYWEIIADKLSKAGWSSLGLQRLIPTGERSGLLTRFATTESVSLCMRMKS
jgi:hypothetical protein